MNLIRMVIFIREMRRLTGLPYRSCRKWSRIWMGDWFQSAQEARESARYCANHLGYGAAA